MAEFTGEKTPGKWWENDGKLLENDGEMMIHLAGFWMILMISPAENLRKEGINKPEKWS